MSLKAKSTRGRISDQEPPKAAPDAAMLDQAPLYATDQDRRRDGRSLRATGRIKPLSTRVKPEVYDMIFDQAAREGVTFAELIERAIIDYVNQKEK